MRRAALVLFLAAAAVASGVPGETAVRASADAPDAALSQVVPAAAADLGDAATAAFSGVLPIRPWQLREALHAANFILSLQTGTGAIHDHPNAGIANTDSHMQYALLGLAAAYWATGIADYRDAMGRALQWLAHRQRKDGSWWIAYHTKPPHRPLRYARGVSATTGLFAYDVWLYAALGGDRAVVRSLLPAVRRGLAFAYRRMRAPDGTFYSAILRMGNRYARTRYRFTADQADMYLGLRAGAALFGKSGYRHDAERLRRALLGPRFFLERARRYAVGLYPNGVKDPRMSILTVWPQGYVPWVIGAAPRTKAAVAFLRSRARTDGSVKVWRHDPVYTLSAEDLVMGTVGTTGGRTTAVAERTLRWLSAAPRDPDTGGLRDHGRKPTKFCNIAGLAVVSWLGVRPRLPG